jgi:hypothetical protein
MGSKGFRKRLTTNENSSETARADQRVIAEGNGSVVTDLKRNKVPAGADFGSWV